MGEYDGCQTTKVKKTAVFEDNEEKIQYLVENRLINKARGLYKMGTIVANCSVVHRT
jgi:hypothetical protein